MVDESVEFETWEEFNEYINSASSSQLHSLAVKHADCWATLSFCKEDQMLWEESGDWGELIFIRVLLAKNVNIQTLKFALQVGSESTQSRAFLSLTLMDSPAITAELLLEIPVDDAIDDKDTARQMFFHPLASIDVLKHVIGSFPEMIDLLVYQEFQDNSSVVDPDLRKEFRESLIIKVKSKWQEVSSNDRPPNSAEQESFDLFVSRQSYY